MNKNAWITVVIVAIVFGGGGFYGGMKYQAGKAASFSGASGFAARAGGAGAAFAGRGGAGGGGATMGTILTIGSGTMTVQLPASTSTTATVGTKIVLFDNTTEVDALETVSPSSLQVGQSVTVTGTANADGSITATSIMARPAGAGNFTGQRGTAQTGGQ